MKQTRKRQKGGLNWQFWKSATTKNKERCMRKKRFFKSHDIRDTLLCDDVDLKYFTFPSDPRLVPSITSKKNLQTYLSDARRNKEMNERDRALFNATQLIDPDLNDETWAQGQGHEKTVGTQLLERPSATVWNNLAKEFNGFSLLQPVSVTELSKGGNGVTHLVTFKNAQHVAFAVLKHSENPLLQGQLDAGFDDVNPSDYVPDNILYEYVVGNTLYNALSNQFCLFVKTWGVYRNLNVKVGMLRATHDNLFPRGTVDQFVDLACREAKNVQILTEYVPTARKLKLSNFVNDRPLLYKLLYQIYGPLGYLNTRYDFSHNDLNVANVILHKLPAPVRFVYVFMDGSPNVEFTCPFLVKLIDYAETTVHSGISRDFLNKLHTTRSCQDNGNPPNVDKLAGFQWFEQKSKKKSTDTDIVKEFLKNDAFPHETVQEWALYLREQLENAVKEPSYPCVTTVYGDQPYVYTETEQYRPSVHNEYTLIPSIGGKKKVFKD
jgi:hypothetical protein